MPGGLRELLGALRPESAHGNDSQRVSYDPLAGLFRTMEHGGRPPGSFSAKAAPGTISVTPTMQAAARVFFKGPPQ